MLFRKTDEALRKTFAALFSEALCALCVICAFFALCACALLASCESAKKPPLADVEVRTITVQMRERAESLDTFGSVTYKKKNEVTSLVEGTIFELNVQEGSKVQKGDVILRMRNIQYEIQRAECKNQLNSAKARLAASQNKLLDEERSVHSRLAKLENSRTALSRKKEELALADKNLERKRNLFWAGGISKSAFEALQVECDTARAETEILEKEIKASELGFRDEDLLAAGIEPSGDGEERIRQLVELNTKGAKIEIELALVEVQNAEQSLRAINSLIENLTIRSPSAGIVGALGWENGERVTQNEKILTVIDMEEPFAQVTVQEKDMEKIELGSPALVEIESLGQTQKSEVRFISPLADVETGNFYVKIPLQNEGEKIRMGMFAQCSIETKSAGKFFELPQSAVLGKNGGNVIFYCVQNGLITQRECPVEMEKDGKLFLAKGVKDGDKIVEFPTAALKEGLHVKEI